MAIDAYMMFVDYDDVKYDAESNVDLSASTEDLASDFKASNGKVFEIDEWSGLSIEHVLSIGSQSTGIGSGRVDFKEFSITRKIDKSSPKFFNMACQGKAFKMVSLALRKAAGASESGQIFLRFDFKLVGIKTITWSHDETSPKEELTFEYGGLLMRYCQQKSGGGLMGAIPGGWNRVKNVKDETTAAIQQT